MAYSSRNLGIYLNLVFSFVSQEIQILQFIVAKRTKCLCPSCWQRSSLHKL